MVSIFMNLQHSCADRKGDRSSMAIVSGYSVLLFTLVLILRFG
jgi:hypothetical protein